MSILLTATLIPALDCPQQTCPQAPCPNGLDLRIRQFDISSTTVSLIDISNKFLRYLFRSKKPKKPPLGSSKTTIYNLTFPHLSFTLIFYHIMDMVQFLLDLTEHPNFQISCGFTIVGLLYLVYFLRYRKPHILFKGEYDIGKKNIRKTPPPYPNGWYNAAKSDELVVGGVKPIDLNGQNMVLFRGKDGVAYALEAYCLHMGAHLGVGGQVVDEKCIECPFHGWLYDGATGHCVDHDGKPLVLKSIEYNPSFPSKECTSQWNENKPVKAALRKYPTSELNGYIYIWIHAVEQHQQTPCYPQLDISSFLSPLSYRGQLQHRISCHIQDIASNGADFVHFKYVHNRIIKSLQSLYFRWQAKWKIADDPDIKSFFQHERKDIRQFKQKVYKELIEPYPRKEVLSVGNLENWIHLPLLGEWFLLSGTIVQVGMGTVFIFLKHKYFEYVVHHYVRPEGVNYQVVLHDGYISPWMPYFISSKILEGEGWQVLADQFIWDAKAFTKRTYLNDQKGDAVMEGWMRWASQFYDGCGYQTSKDPTSW